MTARIDRSPRQRNPDSFHQSSGINNVSLQVKKSADTAPYEVGLHYSGPKDFHVIAAGLARQAHC